MSAEKEDFPVPTKTLLGWVLHGSWPKENSTLIYDKQMYTYIYHDSYKDEVLEKLVQENLGICNDTKNEIEMQECKYAEKIMNKTSKRTKNGKWETGLLWKDNIMEISDSYPTALTRLFTIERKMDKNKKFAEAYFEKILDYIRKGYAQKLNKWELDNSKVEDKKEWYLPHFAVFNSNKPNKLRIVFDAAAKTKGFSFNDLFLKGPDLLVNLVLVLFRKKKL